MKNLNRILFAAILCAFYLTGIAQGKVVATKSEEQPRRPDNFEPFHYKYTIEELYKEFSEEMMKRAAEDVAGINQVNRKGPYAPKWESLDSHQAPEWFEDAKLGIFLDWGPWSVAGWAPAEGNAGTGGSYPDWYEFLMNNYYQEYHNETWGWDFRRDDFLPLLTGANFDASAYVDLAVKAGARYFVPFTRHHGGWAMWDSEYTKRNAVEMGPGRDIYREIAEAARDRNLKLGFYFSISEWEYPAVLDTAINGWNSETSHLGVWKNELSFINWNPVPSSFYPMEMNGLASGKIPVRDYFTDYMMPLFKEGVDKFDPDIVWYDGGWNTSVEMNRTRELAAYFYNQAEGRKEVAVNDRHTFSSMGAHGDFYTREYNMGMGDPIDHKWEVCRSISPAFGYNWQDDEHNSLSRKELIEMFVKIVAENGNLLLVVSPDGSGRLPAIQQDRLLALGEWMAVNSEGIYATRPWEVNVEGDLYFTQSKDGKYVFVHSFNWPEKELTINRLSPVKGSAVKILGVNEKIKWNRTEQGLRITFPDSLRQEKNRPNPYGWTLKVQVK